MWQAPPSLSWICWASYLLPPPSLVPHHLLHSSQSHLFKMETNHTVLSLTLRNGSFRGPRISRELPCLPFPLHYLPFSPGPRTAAAALGFLSLCHVRLAFILGSFLFLLVAPSAPQSFCGQFLSTIPISQPVSFFVAFWALHVSPPQEDLPSPPYLQLMVPTLSHSFLHHCFASLFGLLFNALPPPLACKRDSRDLTHLVQSMSLSPDTVFST